MRKTQVIAVLAVVTMLALALAGCGSEPQPSSSPSSTPSSSSTQSNSNQPSNKPDDQSFASSSEGSAKAAYDAQINTLDTRVASYVDMTTLFEDKVNADEEYQLWTEEYEQMLSDGRETIEASGDTPENISEYLDKLDNAFSERFNTVKNVHDGKVSLKG